MEDDIENKWKGIIESLKYTKANCLEIKQGITKTRGALDEADRNVDRMISDTDKAIKVYGCIPREISTANSTGFSPLVNSGHVTSEQMSFQSTRLRDSIFRIPELLGSTNTSIVAVTTATANMCDIAYYTGVAAMEVVGENAGLREAVEQAKSPNPIIEREAFARKLETIESRLRIKFEGVWQTLTDMSKKDRFRQAAHSMREVLSEFLQALSPDDDVKRAEWWKSDTNDGRPSQRQRVKYAIIQDGKKVLLSEEDVSLIDVLMNDTRNRYEDLNKIAHARNLDAEQSFPLLESYIQNCQTIMTKILELRERHLKASLF